MIKQDVSDVLATLLTQANIVKKEDLVDASNIAKDLSMTLEKALITTGVASDKEMKLALDAVRLLQKDAIVLDVAIRALRLAVQESTNFDVALEKLERIHTATQQVTTVTNELTSLLLAAKLISPDELGRAVKRSQETKIPVGHTLLLMGVVTPALVFAALQAVLTVREGKLDKERSAQALRYANQKSVTLEHALFELDFFVQPTPETLRLSELVHMAGLISQASLVECIELELFKQKQFGQILLEQGLISQANLDAAFTIQGSVADETLKPYQAAAALGRVCKDNINVYQALAEARASAATQREFRLGDLLVASGICSRGTIEKVLEETKQTGAKIGDVLQSAGAVNQSMVYNALRCQSLIRQGFFSPADAILVLSHCRDKQVSLDEALVTLEKNVPSRMQWLWV